MLNLFLCIDTFELLMHFLVLHTLFEIVSVELFARMRDSESGQRLVKLVRLHHVW